jgi:hypothetical protein
MDLEDLIFNEFDRLNVSTNDHPYSGLMATAENSAPDSAEGCDITVIKIYDDHASGFYSGGLLLEYLKGLQPEEVSLDSESHQNIWQHIGEFEVFPS